MTCSHCGGPVSPERAEIGRTTCTKHDCVTAWVSSRRSRMVLSNLHKAGARLQFIDEFTPTGKNS